jgi:hypothetical protein
VILTPPMKQGVLDEDSGKIWRRTTASKVARAPHAPATRLRVGFTRRIKLARGGAWQLRWRWFWCRPTRIFFPVMMVWEVRRESGRNIQFCLKQRVKGKNIPNRKYKGFKPQLRRRKKNRGYCLCGSVTPKSGARDTM